MLLAFGPRRALPVVRTGNVLQWRLLLGPVGLLSLAGILRSLAYVAFSNGAPLWLVERGFAPNAAIISTTLAVFSLSAGVGALLSGTLAIRLPRTGLMVVTMVLAVPALLGALAVPPGSVAYFGLVALGGALANAALPLMVVSGQDLAPHAMGTATGMMLGLTWGTAGMLYIGVGRLQEALGVTTATSLAFLTLLPATILVAWVMRRWPTAGYALSDRASCRGMAHSTDLRERIINAVIHKRYTLQKAADTFDVGAATVSRYLRRYRQTGDLTPRTSPGRPSALNEYQAWVEQSLISNDLTHDQRCDLLFDEIGVRISRATRCRWVQRLGSTRKKDDLRQ